MIKKVFFFLKSDVFLVQNLLFFRVFIYFFFCFSKNISYFLKKNKLFFYFFLKKKIKKNIFFFFLLYPSAIPAGRQPACAEGGALTRPAGRRSAPALPQANSGPAGLRAQRALSQLRQVLPNPSAIHMAEPQVCAEHIPDERASAPHHTIHALAQ